MSLTVQRHVTLYKDARFHAAFPSVAALPDGKLLVVFRRAPDPFWLLRELSPENWENAFSGSLSGKEDSSLGPSFEQKQLRFRQRAVDHIDPRSALSQIIVDPTDFAYDSSKDLLCEASFGFSCLDTLPDAVDQDASLHLLPSGELLLASFAYRPVPPVFADVLLKSQVEVLGNTETTGSLYLYQGGFTRKGTYQLNQATVRWASHQFLPPLPNARPLYPQGPALPGGCIRGSLTTDGAQLYLASYQDRYVLPETLSNSEKNVESRSRIPKPSDCHLWVSSDQGNSWVYRSRIAQDPQGKISYYEPSLYRSPSGKLIAFLRTAPAVTNQPGVDCLTTAVSEDDGYTWQEPSTHPLIGHPCHPLLLPNGQLLLTVGYRHAPYGIHAYLTDAECKHLADSEKLILRSDGACGDLGYPWATCAADGSIWVVYYFCGPDWIRHIAATQLLVAPK
ncbi:MAG: sialidase family protein [Candidatus Melainabacteria bacterium]|nr:sialidase family protein [Candidatus Melainabacteria bacterium]